MAKAKDSPKTGGRKKGVPNKITRDVREAIIEAFSELGGSKYLKAVAKSEPKAFCALLGKVLPSRWRATRRTNWCSGDGRSPTGRNTRAMAC